MFDLKLKEEKVPSLRTLKFIVVLEKPYESFNQKVTCTFSSCHNKQT